MLIIILLAVLFIIGIVLIFVGNYMDENTYMDGDAVRGIGLVFSIPFGATLLVCGLLCIVTQSLSNKEYIEMKYERQVLEYRLEEFYKSNTSTGNELLFSEIVEFNNQIHTSKIHCDNLWTNWFVNGKLAELDYIKINNIEFEY